MIIGEGARISGLGTRHAAKIFKERLLTERDGGWGGPLAEAWETSSYPIFCEQAESWGNPKVPTEPISWEVLD